jgi:hypothetical protein
MRWPFTTALLLVAHPLCAATIGGRLGYPSEELPGMTVVARNGAGETFSIETRPKQARYRLEVPDGRYVVFAIAQGTGEPAGKELRGAHTAYSICARDKARLKAGRCATGPLEEVAVTQARPREDVDIDDWNLPEGLAATLVLQDLFARYPADLNPPAATRETDLSTAPAGADYARIQRAATRGPFFAGRIAVARWPCGEACENWALVDVATGRVVTLDDAALQPLRSTFPCKKAEALEFSEASRLMRVHRLEGERVLTRDFVWSYEAARLEPAGESARTVEEFCQAAARR